MTASELTVGRIADLIGARIEGDPGTVISGMAPIERAVAGQITFAFDDRHAAQLVGCKASAAIVADDQQAPTDLTALRVADPEAAVVKLLGLLATPEDVPAAGVHPSAVVADDAILGQDVAIGPSVTVGAGASIGDRVILCAGVSVGAAAVVGDDSLLLPGAVVRQKCTLGKRCRLHPNAVIGADGFGFYFRDGAHHKVPHAGTVILGDDVEIGSCSCVDRAKFDATRLGDGTKLDNLVQIGHNAQLGRGVVLAAGVLIGGSTVLGDFTSVGGNTVIKDNTRIGPGVRVAGHSGVVADTPEGAVVGGFPAIEAANWRRSVKIFEKLPELRQQFRQLQAQVNAIQGLSKDDRQ